VIDVEPSETVCDDHTAEINPTPLCAGLINFVPQVREVKAKIAQEKSEYDAERMKVIYSGTWSGWRAFLRSCS